MPLLHRNKDKIYARARLKQAQNARFSDGSSDSVSFVNVTEEQIKRDERTGVLNVFRKIFSWILILFMLLLLIAGAKEAKDPILRYLKADAQADGFINEYYKPDQKKELFVNEETRFPIIEFKAEDGQEYRYKAICEVGEPPYHEGIKVTVRYRKSNPEEAIMKAEFEEAALRFAIVAVGAIVILVIAMVIKPKE